MCMVEHIALISRLQVAERWPMKRDMHRFGEDVVDRKDAKVAVHPPPSPNHHATFSTSVLSLHPLRAYVTRPSRRLR